MHPSRSDDHDLIRDFESFSFGSFCFPFPVFLQSNFSQSPQIYATCPPQINVHGSFPSFNIHFKLPCHYGPVLIQDLYKIYMHPPQAPSTEDTWHPSVLMHGTHPLETHDIHLMMTHETQFKTIWTFIYPIFE
jgi:hypothetical protein